MFRSLLKIFQPKSQAAPESQQPNQNENNPLSNETVSLDVSDLQDLRTESAQDAPQQVNENEIAADDVVAVSAENETAEVAQSTSDDAVAVAENTTAEVAQTPPAELEVVEEIIHIQTKSDIETSWTFGGKKPETPNENESQTPESATEPVSHWTFGGADVNTHTDDVIHIDPKKLSPTTKALIDEALGRLPENRAALVGKLDEDDLAPPPAAEAATDVDASESHTSVEASPETPTVANATPNPPAHEPLAAEAATDVDETNPSLPEQAIQPADDIAQRDVGDVPIVAAAAATVLASDNDDAAPQDSWASRLARGLSKSRDKMAKSLAGVFGGGQIDEDLYEELETVLITSDMGIEATEMLMKEVRNRVSLKGLKDGNELRQALKDAVYDLLKPLEQPLTLPENGQPFVIMMAGINGAGKTTSIGKLAKYFQSQGKSVILAAGDTFRAAAREQLQEWGERNGVTVISQVKGDSAAVCFDAVEAAKARKIDVVLADTAGRLPTQLHLMEEIAKVKRVLQKAMPDAPHEILLVLDANIGQNALNQVGAFHKALGITGLIVTKLDGTAKGGVLAALASQYPIPVRYVGVGEGIDDLRPFKARDFVDALLD